MTNLNRPTIRWPSTTPWGAMISVLSTVQDMAIVLVEGDPLGTPRTITGKPDGSGGYLTQDFSKLLFVGVPRVPGDSSVSVELDVNTTLDPGVMHSKNVLWLPLKPDLVGGLTPAYQIDFDGGGLRATPGTLGGGSVFRARSGEINRIWLKNGAMLDGTGLPSGEAVSRVRPSFSGEVVIQMQSFGGIIGPSTFINFVPWAPIPPLPFPVPVIGVVSTDMDSKTFIDPAYQAPGGVSPVSIDLVLASRDSSSYESYDDTIVTPPTLGADNVQDAIDALKTLIPPTFRTDVITRTSTVAGQRGFLLPMGCYVRADPTDLQVEVSTDGGGSWSPLAFGPDWAFTVRQYGLWPQPSTADVSVGAFLSVGRALGDLIRLTWRTAQLQVPPPEPVLVRISAGVLDLTPGDRRYPTGSPLSPNGAILGDRGGLAIEVWRWSTHSGKAYASLAFPGYTVTHPARRWIPYYRYTTAVEAGDLVFDPATVVLATGTPRQQAFRFGYYDPATGARSALSNGVLKYQQSSNDRINGVVRHQIDSLWGSRG